MNDTLEGAFRSNERPRMLSLESRGSCEVPLADIVNSGGLEVFPHVERQGLLFLQFRKNHVTLSAGPFIGLIPLTPRLVIDVKPKLPVSNLARVLDTARESLASLPGANRLYMTDDTSSASILEFIASNLADAVRLIAASGFHKEYVPLSAATSQPRGRIDMMRSVRNCHSRGNSHQVWTRLFEQTTDVTVNRVLKAALELVLLRDKAIFGGSPGQVRALNAVYRELPKTIGSLEGGDLERCRSVIRMRALPEFRSHYYRALEIAVLLLSGRGVLLDQAGADVSLGTYIVNFEKLFEAYLRRCLQNRSEPTFWVRDGNSEGRKPLFDDFKQPPAQPDIVVIEQASRRKLIAEVKYKDRPNREDINQAVTYALSYRTKKTVLVHQVRPGSPRGLRKLGTIDGTEVNAYAFDLGRADLEAEEDAFASCIFELAQAA